MEQGPRKKRPNVTRQPREDRAGGQRPPQDVVWGWQVLQVSLMVILLMVPGVNHEIGFRFRVQAHHAASTFISGLG